MSVDQAVQRVQITRGARQVLWWSIVLTLLLPRVPILSMVGTPLMWLSTVAHELGHGIAAIVLGGELVAFVIRPDGSGTAITSGSSSDVVGALVAAGGLVGPALAAALGFLLARRASLARVALGLFAAVFLIAAVTVAEPGFTRIYLGTVGGLAAAGAGLLRPRWAQFAVVFLAVQLALSVFSRGDYLFTDVAHSSAGAMPSDVAHMARYLGGPYWLWGLVCGLVSVVVLFAGVWFYTRGETTLSLRSLRSRPR